jgi:hypothetical protein
MRARFAVRLASTVAAVMLVWPPTAVRALSTECTGTSQVFNFTGAVQSFTVPPRVMQVTIDAAGAAGGAGGKGAELAASFAVTPGETLNILVGGGGGGSGGGSFVYTSATATGLLIAAAGGGSGVVQSGNFTEGNAGNAASFGNGVGLGHAGSGGNSGGAGKSGGGGGGLLSNGVGCPGCTSFGGGAALANGGAGGAGGSGNGGFGGGGGSGGSGGGGGGGGYNGGGSSDGAPGGGGGSYSAATPSFAQSGAQSGNGQVSVCFIVTFAGTPGKANCHGQSVSALAQQFGGLNNAAAALDFPSVRALQDAIQAFCGS